MAAGSFLYNRSAAAHHEIGQHLQVMKLEVAVQASASHTYRVEPRVEGIRIIRCRQEKGTSAVPAEKRAWARGVEAMVGEK